MDPSRWKNVAAAWLLILSRRPVQEGCDSRAGYCQACISGARSRQQRRRLAAKTPTRRSGAIFFCEPAGMCRRPGSMWRSAPLGTKTSTTGSRKIRGQHWDIRGTRHVQRDSHSGALHLDSEPQSLAGKSKVGANVKSKRFAGRSKVGTGVLKGQR